MKIFAIFLFACLEARSIIENQYEVDNLRLKLLTYQNATSIRLGFQCYIDNVATSLHYPTHPSL